MATAFFFRLKLFDPFVELFAAAFSCLGIARDRAVVDNEAVAVMGRTLKRDAEVSSIEGLDRHFQQLDDAMTAVVDVVESIHKEGKYLVLKLESSDNLLSSRFWEPELKGGRKVKRPSKKFEAALRNLFFSSICQSRSHSTSQRTIEIKQWQTRNLRNCRYRSKSLLHTPSIWASSSPTIPIPSSSLPKPISRTI